MLGRYPPYAFLILEREIEQKDYLSLSISLTGDGVPRNTLEAYGDIVATIYLAHQEKPFPRSELMNLFFQEMNILLEDTRTAHLKTMITLEYVVLHSQGTAYKQTMYRLGPRGVETAKQASKDAV